MYIKNKKMNFNDALPIIYGTDFFILKKDLICENGIFKAGTRVRLLISSKSLHSVRYDVISEDAKDNFSLTDSLTAAKIQEFFESTFVLDEIAKRKMEQFLEKYDCNTDKLQKRMDKLRIGNCIVLAIFITLAFILINETLFLFIAECSIIILDVLVLVLLNYIEGKKIHKMRSILSETVNTILKGGDM